MTLFPDPREVRAEWENKHLKRKIDTLQAQLDKAVEALKRYKDMCAPVDRSDRTIKWVWYAADALAEIERLGKG